MGDSLIRYMRAHVRAQTGHPARDWTPDEIAETFLLLPAPAVSAPDWIARIGEAQQPEAQDYRESNQEIIDGILKASPKDVRLEVVA
jgi:hypothetical protein